MLKAFSSRRAMSKRKGLSDGSLDGEDGSLVKSLRQQVSQLTIEKAEVEKDFMNALASMEKENGHKLNSMEERIKETEEANSFLKISKNSLVQRVLDLELKLTEGEKDNNKLDLDQKKKIENSTTTRTSSDVNNKATQVTIQQLDGNGANNQIVEKYDSEVKRNTLLEEQIRIITVREDTTNKRLAEMKQDTDKSLLRQSKTIELLKEELDSYKENIIKPKRKLLSAMETSVGGGHTKLHTRRLKQNNSKPINACTKFGEEEKEFKGMIKRDNDDVALLLEDQTLMASNLSEQLQLKETVISLMVKSENDLICQKNVLEQKYLKEIEGLKVKLNQRNVKIAQTYCDKFHMKRSRRSLYHTETSGQARETRRKTQKIQGKIEADY